MIGVSKNRIGKLFFRLQAVGQLIVALFSNRDIYNKARTIIRFTFYGYGSAVHFYKFLRNGQPYPTALVQQTVWHIILEKTLKYFFLIFSGYSYPRIDHLYLQHLLFA